MPPGSLLIGRELKDGIDYEKPLLGRIAYSVVGRIHLSQVHQSQGLEGRLILSVRKLAYTF